MRISFTKHPLVLAIAACIGSQAHAEGANPPIEEVHVWGTEVNASSLNLGEEAIAIRQADHISDLLRFIPGVDVGGAHSLNQRITIRSLDDKDLDVRVDGAVQNTYMFHHMGNLQIHADILKSADIEVGNNSVINGGLGGVSRFETRSAKEMLEEGSDFGARYNATYASNASIRTSLTNYGQVSDSVDALFYINRVNRGNYKVGGGEIKDQDGNLIPSTDGKVRGIDGELTDALLKVGFDISDNQRIKAGYEFYIDEGDYSARPDMGLATDTSIGRILGIDGGPQLYPTKFTRDTATLNYDASFNNLTLEAVIFTNKSDLEREESYMWRGSLVNELNEGEAKNIGANLLAEQIFEGNVSNKLTYGGELVKYDTEYNSRNLDTNQSEQSGETAQSIALFIQDRIEIGNFSVTPGARFNQWDIDSNLIKETYNEPTFSLAVDYTLGSHTTFKASSTQLFKGPELSEVFVGAGIGDTYNEDIKAETGTNSEIGVAFQGDTFQFGLTGFETQINDYIYDYVNYEVRSAQFAKDNIGDMELTGFEAFAGFSLSNLDILLTYTDMDSELSAFDNFIDQPFDTGAGIEIDEGFDGARTDRSHGETIGLNVDYFLPTLGLQFHYDMMHIASIAAGKDLDGAGMDNSKDGYNVHNISVKWQPKFAESFSLTIGADNLFDEYYASQASRTGVSFHPVFGPLYLTDYEPGRNIKASVAYQF